ncbi:MAG TPA: hypothetical protein VNO30_48985 [Kofleriaceae bacterium]|nr:hypothetical protein [Kofleriaceae bacterium]
METSEPPAARDAREYLLDGALFDERPEIAVHDAPDGSFERMELRYDHERSPMVLRRLTGEDAEAARAEAIDVAHVCGRDDIAAAVEQSKLVLEWEVDRAELDEDAWFALHLWQAWMLGPSHGWLYAPGDGLFDAELKRCCPAGGPSPVTQADL